ncbi:MAG: hypothetical protein J7K63_08665 [Candidatus Marinimicrobia bacterium]|nr:hypothetical protein [Candidatus Neomarinimicrobiota bacterium]
MKRNYYILLIIVFVCVYCTERIDSINGVTGHCESLFLKDGPSDRLCINNRFPDYSLNSLDTAGWKSCEFSTEEEVTYFEGAYLWAAFNPKYNENLSYKACGENIPSVVPPVRNFVKNTNNLHPSMKWNFTWGHYYILKRKIGNGAWQTVFTDSLLSYAYVNNNIPDTVYTDFTINLKNLEGYVWYAIYNKLWDSLSPASILVWPAIPQIDR